MSIGGRVLAASLLVGAGVASGWALSSPADALGLPPISVPPVSVGPVVTPPVQTPPVAVPVPSTVAVGPLVVTAPDVSTGPDGGLRVRVPLPSGQGTEPQIIGVDLGRDRSTVSLPPLGGGTIGPSLPVDSPASDPAGSGSTPSARAARVDASEARGSDRAGTGTRSRADAAAENSNATAEASSAARSQRIEGEPARATGSITNAGGGGLRSLLASAAHNKITWLVLIALALIARYVMTWAWRDAITATARSRSGDRSATA